MLNFSFNHYLNMDNLNYWDDKVDKLNDISNLAILIALKKYGFPDDSSKRAKIIHALRLKQENNYPLDYDGLAEFLPGFSALYPQEEIINNATAVITGKEDYFKEVLSSDLTEEQKEILLLSIPL